MNPELLRNLWLEASPFRLALITGFVLLVFAASSVALGGLISTSSAALALYWFFAVLWGTRSAALSVVGEIRERTWDSQKLSSIGPWDMVWGKLLGATFANWFGALLCLPFIVVPLWRDHGPGAAIVFGVVLVMLGLLAQAVALLSSLNVIRRNTGNWRLDIFLCQVAGIGAAFVYYTMWSSGAAFMRSGDQGLQWWGHVFNLRAFHLVSLLTFTAWALIGCWRAMRTELRFANGPWVWLAWLLYLCIYQAGFVSWIAARIPGAMMADSGLHAAAMRMLLAVLALLGSAYGMVFLEPKDPVRLRWLGEQFRAGRFGKVFLSLDAWMLSYGAAMAGLLALAILLWRDGAALGHVAASDFAPVALAMMGFLTRDVGVFLLMRGFARGRGDFAALAVLGALYLLLPAILHGVGLDDGAQFLFLPSLHGPALLEIVVAWLQGAALAVWALRAARPKFNAS
ncbi:MAG TPA: hypothetical protein VFQ52_01165 [Rhizomicrobium sp.]|nr:hypothetical protein [Rhizomicrobium sp.]